VEIVEDAADTIYSFCKKKSIPICEKVY